MNYDAPYHRIITVVCKIAHGFLWIKKGELSEDRLGIETGDSLSIEQDWPEEWHLPEKLKQRFVKWMLNYERHSLLNPGFTWDKHFQEEDVLVDGLQKVSGWKEYTVRPSTWQGRLSEQCAYDQASAD